VYAKVSGFLASLVIVRLLTSDIYGSISYASSIIVIISPFAGFGAMYSLLRFGSISSSDEEKNLLFRYSLTRGAFFSSLIIIFLILFSWIYSFKIESARIFLVILSFQLLTSGLFEILQSYKRIKKKNKEYAISNIINSSLGFFLSLVGVILFSGYGYAVSSVITPLIVFILFYIRLEKKSLDFGNAFLDLDKKKFWFYGFNVGLGSIAGQILYSLDIFLIGLLLVDSRIVALYKVATIIPYNLIFIPMSFMVTDFVLIAENFKDIYFLKKQAKKYIILFSVLVIVILIPIYLFSKPLIKIIFGNNYENSYQIARVLIIGIAGGFVFRIPFGNILGAVGKAHWNVLNAYCMLLLNILLDYFFIIKYGAIGAAYATSILMWASGIVSFSMFLLYVKKLEDSFNKESR
jgi:O-antigen/teichoic acid export membrane protein